MTEQTIVEVYGELVHVHSESDVEAVGEVVFKRGRGRPRKEKPPKEKQQRGRPRKIREPKEKQPIGRPRQIRGPKEKRPPGIPKTWTEEHMADRPKHKPKDPEYFKIYYVNVIKPKLEARQVEELNGKISLPLLTA